MRDVFLYLIRLGIGLSVKPISKTIDWGKIQVLAEQQGLSAIVLDGIEELSSGQRPQQAFLLNWIGEVLHGESINSAQQKAAIEMASLFNSNHIRTYVLKGAVIAECYPKPSHRVSVDMDCFLIPEKSDFEAWTLGNDLIKGQGYKVSFDYYKNSTFHLPGLAVESHRYFTPFRGNKRLAALEKKLQKMLRQDKGEDIIEGTWLYRPPVMVTALFLIEHAYSHFLHEGLTWRMVLDWMMFKQKHDKEIDWASFVCLVDEYGFRRFYDSYNRLGKYLVGELSAESLEYRDSLMLRDIWAELDLHETVKGLKGKLALAGNTWRARWKYKYFSEDSMLKALWLQIKGVLFEKNPQLN